MGIPSLEKGRVMGQAIETDSWKLQIAMYFRTWILVISIRSILVRIHLLAGPGTRELPLEVRRGRFGRYLGY